MHSSPKGHRGLYRKIEIDDGSVRNDAPPFRQTEIVDAAVREDKGKSRSAMVEEGTMGTQHVSVQHLMVISLDVVMCRCVASVLRPLCVAPLWPFNFDQRRHEHACYVFTGLRACHPALFEHVALGKRRLPTALSRRYST